jgi:tight adherence protein C
MDTTVAILLILLAGAIAFAVWAAIRGGRLGIARSRLGIDDSADPTGALEYEEESDEPFGGAGMRHWLGVAGFRARAAPVVFLFICAISAALGLMVAVVGAGSGVFASMAQGLEAIPGDFGQVLVPLVSAIPWLLFLAFAALPFLVVRSARRTLVEAADRELPVLLELFATLAEAGLGFDAAVQEILDSDQGEGYLADEFRNFQRETLSGVPRVKCLRRLARRVDVPQFSTFISSLVQAEQGGLGLSDVLQNQAGDMRNRRRENALMKAQALPVKLVFPLVLCFLPALFVFTLGPAFFTFFKVTDTVTGNIKRGK